MESKCNQWKVKLSWRSNIMTHLGIKQRSWMVPTTLFNIFKNQAEGKKYKQKRQNCLWRFNKRVLLGHLWKSVQQKLIFASDSFGNAHGPASQPASEIPTSLTERVTGNTGRCSLSWAAQECFFFFFSLNWMNLTWRWREDVKIFLV